MFVVKACLTAGPAGRRAACDIIVKTVLLEASRLNRRVLALVS